MKRFFVPAAALLLLQLIATRADSMGLLVSPAQVGLVGKAGSTVSGIISVSSSRREQTQVRISLADFVRDLDGKVHEIPATEAKRSCKQWLEIDQREFTSPESGTVPLVVSAKISENASGSYWALVNIEAVPAAVDRRTERAVGIQIIPRIAIPVVITVSGTENISVRAEEVHVTPQSDGVDTYVIIRNDGNTAILLSGALVLERGSGNDSEEVASVDVNPITSLPGTSVKVKGLIPWKGDPSGLQAHAYLRYGPNPEQTLEAVTRIPAGHPGTADRHEE